MIREIFRDGGDVMQGVMSTIIVCIPVVDQFCLLAHQVGADGVRPAGARISVLIAASDLGRILGFETSACHEMRRAHDDIRVAHENDVRMVVGKVCLQISQQAFGIFSELSSFEVGRGFVHTAPAVVRILHGPDEAVPRNLSDTSFIVSHAEHDEIAVLGNPGYLLGPDGICRCAGGGEIVVARRDALLA